MKTVYEVLEFDSETGETAGVFLTTALGPAHDFNAAEQFCRFDDVRATAQAFLIEMEAGGSYCSPATVH